MRIGTWDTDQPKERGCWEATNEANSERGRMMEDRWLSVDEIADHLGIKRDTVYKWISERKMPGHKIGRLCVKSILVCKLAFGHFHAAAPASVFFSEESRLS